MSSSRTSCSSPARRTLCSLPTGIQGAPDLVIEILSPGTRTADERVKRDRYARFGVGEYWIVDLEFETIEIQQLIADGYGSPREFALERGERVSSPFFPGLELALEQVFSD
jgi:Uma2 family endonuclease